MTISLKIIKKQLNLIKLQKINNYIFFKLKKISHFIIFIINLFYFINFSFFLENTIGISNNLEKPKINYINKIF